MKIILAPDSFKECLSAQEVAAVWADAAREHWPGAEIVEMPLADGGEGTLDVLAAAMGADICQVSVHDPLGRSVQASYGVAGETAIIEVAQACGLQLLQSSDRNPLIASSRGVGELLMAAYGEGCRHFLVGLGGSAICDGGAGMMEVPGIKNLTEITIELLCDVNAPFVGPKGAARVFAPQKGASPEDVEVLEERMLKLAARMLNETGVDVTNLPGAGAAGGLGGAFMAYLGAKRISGIQKVLDLYRFSEVVEGACLVITGEGKSDAQTLQGKVPLGVLQNAKGTPVALLSGKIENSPELLRAGFQKVLEVSPRSLSVSEALKPEVARALLREAVLTL
jgi:glycerate kinase